MKEKQSNEREDIPKILKPFIELGFEFSWTRATASEAFSDCIFCGRLNKLYINMADGRWGCKAASCSRSGNTYTFMREWYAMIKEMQDQVSDSHWDRFCKDRKLPREVLEEYGVSWDEGGNRWVFPIFDSKGDLVNFRFYRVGGKVRAMSGLDLSLFGVETHKYLIKQPRKIIFLLEGESDCFSFRLLLEREGKPGVVYAVPGSAFKEAWVKHFIDADLVILGYDVGAENNRDRTRKLLLKGGYKGQLQFIKWPIVEEGLPNGTDIRDFISFGAKYEDFEKMFSDFSSEEILGPNNNTALTPNYKENPDIHLDSPCTTFDQVLETYDKHVYMTGNMKLGLRIAYAAALTVDVPGDPLWVHIVGPPGSGKTLVVMSLSHWSRCVALSKVSPTSLVSGFRGQNGEDPSILSKMNERIMAIKDWTEIYSMPQAEKEEVLSIFRGAFDGSVVKPYGNGMVRTYDPLHFNMITGVTYIIYAETSSALGERFVMFHIEDGIGFKASHNISKAIDNVGKDPEITYELAEATKTFLDSREKVEIETPAWFKERMIHLSQLVSILRGTVDRDVFRDVLRSTPQHEMGTRIAKTLTKAAIGLAKTYDPQEITQEVYTYVKRIARDTCPIFVMKIMNYLIDNSRSSPMDISHATEIPLNTVRSALYDMELLHAVTKTTVEEKGMRFSAVTSLYSVSEVLKDLWVGSHFSGKKEGYIEKEDRVDEKIVRRPIIRVKLKKKAI